MKLGILIGGGDCSGLNAVICAVVRGAVFDAEDVQVLGIEDGFDGLVAHKCIFSFILVSVRGIHSRGGMILGIFNWGNFFKYL